eukprot:tig00000219_g19465.t1
MKRGRGEYDVADFVLHAFRQLKRQAGRGGRGGPAPFHFVAVDEVQDLSIAQIALFSFVSGNADGFALAGDTAQTIAQGSGFRFQGAQTLIFTSLSPAAAAAAAAAAASAQRLTPAAVADVKSFFYKHALPHIAGPGQRAGGPARVPPVRLLRRNFRTHAGVLNLSTSLAVLLRTLFPNSIDEVKMEEALKLGPLPLLVRPASLSAPEFAALLAQKEWTADEVVIVRDEEQKQRLESLYRSARGDAGASFGEGDGEGDGDGAGGGGAAILLTAFESKGFEFQDVVLYNFVAGSPCAKLYAVLGRLAAPVGDFSYARDFEPELLKYGPLCHELKLLYVAATRAKGQLVLFEEGEAAAPLERLWRCLEHCEASGAGRTELVHATADPQEGLDALCSASPDAEERRRRWDERGMEFMEQQQYENARLCFRNAGNRRGRDWAIAEIEHEEALREAAAAGGGDAAAAQRARKAVELLTRAAERLLALAPPMTDKAVAWFMDALPLAERCRAGPGAAGPASRSGSGSAPAAAPVGIEGVALRIAPLLEKGGAFLEAGRVLLQAGLHARAVDSFCRDGTEAGLHRALDACLQSGDLRRVLEIVRADEAGRTAAWRSPVLLECARRAGASAEADGGGGGGGGGGACAYGRGDALAFLQLLPSEDERAAALEAHGFLDELVELEAARGNHARAARLLRRRGELPRAAEALRRGKDARGAVGCTLAYARAHVALDGRPVEGALPLLRELLGAARADLARLAEAEAEAGAAETQAADPEASLEIAFLAAVVEENVEQDGGAGAWAGLAAEALALGRPDLRLRCLLRACGALLAASPPPPETAEVATGALVQLEALRRALQSLADAGEAPAALAAEAAAAKRVFSVDDDLDPSGPVRLTPQPLQPAPAHRPAGQPAPRRRTRAARGRTARRPRTLRSRLSRRGAARSPCSSPRAPPALWARPAADELAAAAAALADRAAGTLAEVKRPREAAEVLFAAGGLERRRRALGLCAAGGEYAFGEALIDRDERLERERPWYFSECAAALAKLAARGDGEAGRRLRAEAAGYAGRVEDVDARAALLERLELGAELAALERARGRPEAAAAIFAAQGDFAAAALALRYRHFNNKMELKMELELSSRSEPYIQAHFDHRGAPTLSTSTPSTSFLSDALSLAVVWGRSLVQRLDEASIASEQVRRAALAIDVFGVGDIDHEGERLPMPVLCRLFFCAAELGPAGADLQSVCAWRLLRAVASDPGSLLSDPEAPDLLASAIQHLYGYAKAVHALSQPAGAGRGGRAAAGGAVDAAAASTFKEAARRSFSVVELTRTAGGRAVDPPRVCRASPLPGRPSLAGPAFHTLKLEPAGGWLAPAARALSDSASEFEAECLALGRRMAGADVGGAVAFLRALGPGTPAAFDLALAIALSGPYPRVDLALEILEGADCKEALPTEARAQHCRRAVAILERAVDAIPAHCLANSNANDRHLAPALRGLLSGFAEQQAENAARLQRARALLRELQPEPEPEPEPGPGPRRAQGQGLRSGFLKQRGRGAGRK